MDVYLDQTAPDLLIAVTCESTCKSIQEHRMLELVDGTIVFHCLTCLVATRLDGPVDAR